MIIKALIRNNICLNSHPTGCVALVEEQINYVKSIFPNPVKPGPKLALIIGCSSGYGLASRIVAAYGYGAATIGVSFEKAGSVDRPGTAGWYNNLAFEAAAKRTGLDYLTVDGDAYTDETKQRCLAAIRSVAQKAGLEAKIDLIVYSLASAVRTDPLDNQLYRSVIKPITKEFRGLTIDAATGQLAELTIEPASQAEIAATVKVMGGEDWALWLNALRAEGLLAPEVKTVAYSYIGPELSWGLYRDGTIGQAKDHLEKTARQLNAELSAAGGGAWVSINKALVTRASAVIPTISVYIACLFKQMKQAGLHEACIEQMTRLYRDRLYLLDKTGRRLPVPTDQSGRIRLDDWELRPEIQAAVNQAMVKLDALYTKLKKLSVAEPVKAAGTLEFAEIADIDGFINDFLQVHGFAVAGVNYDADIDPSAIKELSWTKRTC